MSLVRLPRQIRILRPLNISISISGNYYSSSYGYVKVNGTTYTSNKSLSFTVPPDSNPEIVVYCGTSYGPARNNCFITLDGVTVLSGTGSYTFTANKSYTITLTRSGSSSSTRYWTAAIVSS